MVELQPFEGASNRTSIVILEKGRQTEYPVPYNLWWKKVTGKSIGTDFTLSEVNEIATYHKFYGEPVDEKDLTSPWLTGRQRALKAIKKILGKSDYEAHAGCYTGGANGVYWVDILDKRPDGLVVVSNITEGAKRKVESVQAALERDLLYPLLRGRDVRRWQAQPSAYILLTHKPGMRLNAITEEKMKTSYPKTFQYLKRFEKELRERKSRGVSDMVETGAPFYTMFAVGDYTFAPYKVVWTRMAKIEAAVVTTQDGKSTIPQETITLVACDTDNEAHYIASLVNSSVFQYAATSYSQAGGKSMGSMHVLENIRIPKFNPKDKIHLELASLSQQAHQAAADGDQETIVNIEKCIDELAAELWGLTKEELKEIQESLEELK